MRAQLKDMMEKHELEMTKVKAKYNAELHEIQEKHETELQEKDQALVQLQKQVAELSAGGQSNSKEVKDLESITKEKMEELEGILLKQLSLTLLKVSLPQTSMCFEPISYLVQLELHESCWNVIATVIEGIKYYNNEGLRITKIIMSYKFVTVSKSYVFL